MVLYFIEELFMTSNIKIYDIKLILLFYAEEKCLNISKYSQLPYKYLLNNNYSLNYKK